MIPFQLQNEPALFNEKVRIEGQKHLVTLRKLTRPVKSTDFKNHDYWLECREDLKKSFNGLCAYCAFYESGPGEVDHFVSKTEDIELAYEWKNLRFCSSHINKKKSNCSGAILDPINVRPGWFYVHIPTFLLRVSSIVPEPEKTLALATIDQLDLNSQTWKEARRRWLEDFLTAETIDDLALGQLMKFAPLLADALIEYRQAARTTN